MSEERKVFEDWPQVDCNECARYWDSSCDGVKTSSEASKRPCNSFLATRSVIIPAQIESIRGHLKRLYVSLILMWACFIIKCLSEIF